MYILRTVSIHASMKEATEAEKTEEKRYNVSIHASMKEATHELSGGDLGTMFQSTPP